MTSFPSSSWILTISTSTNTRALAIQWGQCQQVVKSTNSEARQGFPNGWSGKESVFNAGDTGDAVSVPGLGRSPVRGDGNPPHYSCLKNHMDRGAWRATVQRVGHNWAHIHIHTAVRWGSSLCLSSLIEENRGVNTSCFIVLLQGLTKLICGKKLEQILELFSLPHS